MQHRLFSSFILVLFSFTSMANAATSLNRDNLPRFVEDELLIKFKDGISASAKAAINNQINSKTIKLLKLIGISHVKLPKGTSVSAIIAQLANNPNIDYIQPNYLYYLNQIPNDTQFNSLWGLNNTAQTGGTANADIDAPEAWDISTGSVNNVIAVIDSGMDLTHPDLAANLWINPNEIAGNGIDDDGNGYIDDVNGWNFVNNNNDPSPAGAACNGHGTHTAGTIGAVGNNNLGVTGVNWDVKIMPLRAFDIFLGIFCTANDAALIEAIQYHTTMGVRISSNSWGGSVASPAISNAIKASNSLFVAAAGNSGADTGLAPEYPAAYDLDNIVSVAASTHNDVLASFSNFGDLVDIAAPGENILSTLPVNAYGSLSGTSMATPHVAGVAGLLLAQDPTLTIREMKDRLLANADILGLPINGGGRMNAFSSLSQGLSTPDVSVNIVPVTPTTVSPGEVVQYTAEFTNNTPNPINTTVKAYYHLNSGFGANGNEATIGGPANLVLAANEVFSTTLSVTVPATVPLGSSFSIILQSSDPFEEDEVVYTVQ